jgi:hypothetical protein
MSLQPVMHLPLTRSFQEVLEEALRSDEADPRAIAARVERAITDEMLRDALRAMLPSYVRYKMSLERRASPITAVKDVGPTTSPQQARSWKVDAIRAQAQAERHKRYAVPTADGREQWKLLHDCTPADLAIIVQMRRDHAAATLCAAEKLDRLRATLVQKKADTVADLSDADLVAALKG